LSQDCQVKLKLELRNAMRFIVELRTWRT